MVAHYWLWSSYHCFLGGHLSISEKRPHSGSKLIIRTGMLSAQFPLSKPLSLVHISWMLPRMSFRRGEKEIPTRFVGESGTPQSPPRIMSWPWSLTHLLSSLFIGQALALSGGPLSAWPVIVYWGGDAHGKGEVFIAPHLELMGREPWWLPGISCSVWIHRPCCPPKEENWF